MDETFTLLPLHLDPSSKSLTSPTSPSLQPLLTSLNTTHRTLLTLPPESHQTPPPPMPTNPKRSAQIQKMREQGNTALRKSTPTSGQEAVKFYTYAIEMALGRPAWEPSGLVREECSMLYSNRAQAYIAAMSWAEGAADAEASVWCKRAGNAKAWWRWGVCLTKMGEWERARGVLREGVEVAGGEDEQLASLLKEVEENLVKRF